MEHSGIFLFPGNIHITPYDYGKEFAPKRASDKAIEIINFLTPEDSEYTKTPNHLFSLLRPNSHIIFAQLMTLIFGTYAGYACYKGAAQDDLNEIYRGFSDNLPFWVPDASWREKNMNEIMYCAGVIYRALRGRAERIDNIGSINDLLNIKKDAENKVPVKLLLHLQERAYADENPERDPLCHIASFEDMPTGFVEYVIYFYKQVFIKNGLTEPFIGYPDIEYFKVFIGHSVRNIISTLINYNFAYIRQDEVQ